jgi:Cyclin M transmembrane N-terminal domain
MTLTGILAGAFSGATLADRIEEWVEFNTAIAAYGKPISIVVVVVAVTYFTLVIGELVPKQVALKNPEAIAVRVAPRDCGLRQGRGPCSVAAQPLEQFRAPLHATGPRVRAPRDRRGYPQPCQGGRKVWAPT